MANTGGADRRTSGRRKVLRTGVAIFDDGQTLQHVKCTIYDLGDDSIKLRPEVHGILPARFRLQLPTREVYQCTVVRRSGYLLAVKVQAEKPAR